jgi:peptidoglycan hydrolase-like protein with peptidoglycan-binding domain
MPKAALAAWIAAFTLLTMSLIGVAAAQPQSQYAEPGPVATAALVREIQFMLLTVGIDPGPIDGNARQLTNRAVRLFQQRNGLPETELVTNGPVPPAFLERLRREAARVMLKPEPSPPPQAIVTPPPTPPQAIVTPPPAPPPDRFASCAYNANDFRVGGRQYTPQSFLDEGFDGATNRAVVSLRQRLQEARQIAEGVGGPALLEVQRQARVLAYFECRQKIEQASATTR